MNVTGWDPAAPAAASSPDAAKTLFLKMESAMKRFSSLSALILSGLLVAAGWAPATAVGAEGGNWRSALPGWEYRFPADHAVHRDFKTEWWYFTGHVRETGSDSGREFGYELTFFRQGVIPPGRRGAARGEGATDRAGTGAASGSGGSGDAGAGEAPARSRFVQDDFKFAHLAVTDVTGRRFVFTQKATRGAFGEAGFGDDANPETAPTGAEPRLAWIEGWELRVEADGAWRIVARSTDPAVALDFRVRPTKPPVIHGIPGENLSRKAAGEGNASHYYSFTRMETAGTLAFGDRPAAAVRGESWFDHEWASNGLGPDQVGWDWFSFHFEDGTELMLYAMRRRDGTMDPVSNGTLVATDGQTTHLRREDFELKPAGTTWKSPKTGAVYPTVWQVRIPGHGFDFTVRPRLDEQELALPQIAYWEGAMTVSGTRAGQPLRGRGYMELTGYAGPLVGLGR